MYFVSIETVKIKDFIFNSNKLKSIRGASYLLDFTNKIVVKKILDKHDIKEENIVYIAAGNAKFYVETEEKAKKIEIEILTEYKKIAPDSNVVVSCIKSENNKLWEDIDKAAKKTNNKKNKGFSKINIDLPFIEKCGICCYNPVEIKKENFHEKFKIYVESFNEYTKEEKINEIIKLENDKELVKNQLFGKEEEKEIGVCPSCFAKYVFADLIKSDFQKVGFYNEFREALSKEYGEKIRDVYKEAEAIKNYESEKSFIGFMYADGDSVGEFLKNAKDEFIKDTDDSKYREFVKKFSEKLDEITKTSLIEVLIELRNEEKINKYFGEFLIVGGDDVCGVFPANIVLEVSKRFQEKFNDKMREFSQECKFNSKGSNITSSSGVIIAKAKTPLYYLFDLSLELQKNAKKKRYDFYKDNKDVEFKNGFIDFQVIGAEGTTDIEAFRKNKSNLIKRPYVVGEEENVENIQSLFTFIKELKKVNFPKNKLRRYYDLKIEVENNENKTLENMFEILNTTMNLDEKQKKVMLKWIGIENLKDLDDNTLLRKVLNNIFDVLEIYDFNNGGKNADKI